MSIRFIVADLDGTLLDSEKRFSPDLFPLIEQLWARGIRFAPASGRQYYNLREQFAPIADNLIYIAENGAMVCDGEKMLSFAAMPQEIVCRAVEQARGLEGVSVVLSCRDGAYYERTRDVSFQKNMAQYYTRRCAVDDLLALARTEPVCKVALFCKNKAEERLLPAFRSFAQSAQVALSGADWIDLMSQGMNKGVAVTMLCCKLGIGREECMAFGDYLNDFELLQAVGESYCMENGHPTLKAIARHIAPPNDADGVCCTIRSVLRIDK